MVKGIVLFEKLEDNRMFYYFILCNKQINRPVSFDLIKEIYQFYGLCKIDIKNEQYRFNRYINNYQSLLM